MNAAEVVLSNALADVLAHHEASGGRSLVRVADPDGTERWLDFESAGKVAAAALEHVGTIAGRPMFAVRSTTFRTAVADDLRSEVSSATASADGAVASPSADVVSPEETAAVEAAPDPRRALVSRIISLGRHVMPADAQRHNSLKAWMREYGVLDPKLVDLRQLTEAQLLAIVDRLTYYGRISHRIDTPAGSST